MTKYLFQANYLGDGISGLMREGGTARRDAVVAAMQSVGGTLECFYYAFGDTDVLGVLDVGDEASAVAMSLLINSTGAVDMRLTPLMEPSVIDAAVSKTPAYRPPGR